ncbi:MAG: hypothetical protein IT173_10145 [Acidobacteria bacterium]|nr:hypothetical protein [Acidobacteriota bacterium]
MVSIFMNYDKSDHTKVVLDPHTASPGGRVESTIIRNPRTPVIEARQTEIFTQARRIFKRGRRASMVRGSGII